MPSGLKIEVFSEGFCEVEYCQNIHGSSTYKIPDNKPFIQVNGVDVVRTNQNPQYSYGRGLNVAIIDQNTGELSDFNVFDTCNIEGKKNASKIRDSFIGFVRAISKGKIVVITIIDAAATNLYTKDNEESNKELNAVFRSLGSQKYSCLNYHQENQNLERTVAFRCAWTLVVVKGNKSSICEKFAPRLVNTQTPCGSPNYSKAAVCMFRETVNYAKLKERGNGVNTLAEYLKDLVIKKSRDYLELMIDDVPIKKLKKQSNKLIKALRTSRAVKDLVTHIFADNCGQFIDLYELAKIEKLLPPETVTSLIIDLKIAFYDALNHVVTKKLNNDQQEYQNDIGRKKELHGQYKNEKTNALKTKKKEELESLLYRLFSDYFFISNAKEYRQKISKIKKKDALISLINNLSLKKELTEKITAILQHEEVNFCEIHTFIESILSPITVKENSFDSLVLEVYAKQHATLGELNEAIQSECKKYPEFMQPCYQKKPYQSMNGEEADKEKQTYPCFIFPENHIPKVEGKAQGIYLYRCGADNFQALVIHNESFYETIDLRPLTENNKPLLDELRLIQWPEQEKKAFSQVDVTDFILDKACVGIREIHIYVPGVLYLDRDMRCRGKNVRIQASEIDIKEDVTIDLSGRAGQGYKKPARDGVEMRKANNKTSAEAQGEAGEDGGPGTPGESSGNFSLDYDCLVGNKELKVLCHGGRGADGQQGGHGEQGRSGENGVEGAAFKGIPFALRRTVEVNKAKFPTPGGRGGNSGCNGEPGEGGFPGAVYINKGCFITGEKKLGARSSVKYANILIDARPGLDGGSPNQSKGGLGGEGGEYARDNVKDYTVFWVNRSDKFYPWEYEIEDYFWCLTACKRLHVLGEEKYKEHSLCAKEGESGDVSEGLTKSRQPLAKAYKNEFRLNIHANTQGSVHIEVVNLTVLNKLDADISKVENEIENLGKQSAALNGLLSSIREEILKAKEEVEHQQQLQHAQYERILADFDTKFAQPNEGNEWHVFSPEPEEESSKYKSFFPTKQVIFNKYKKDIDEVFLEHLETLLVKLLYAEDVNDGLRSDYDALIGKWIVGLKKHPTIDKREKVRYLLQTASADLENLVLPCQKNQFESLVLKKIIDFNTGNEQASVCLPELLVRFRKRKIKRTDLKFLIVEMEFFNEERLSDVFKENLIHLIEQQYLYSMAYLSLEKIQKTTAFQALSTAQFALIVADMYELYGTIRKELVEAGLIENLLPNEELLTTFSMWIFDNFGSLKTIEDNQADLLNFYKQLNFYKKQTDLYQILTQKMGVGSSTIQEEITERLRNLLAVFDRKFNKETTNFWNMGKQYLKDTLYRVSISDLIEEFRILLFLVPKFKMDANSMTEILSAVTTLKNLNISNEEYQEIRGYIDNLSTILDKQTVCFKGETLNRQPVLPSPSVKIRESNFQDEANQIYQDMLDSMGFIYEVFLNDISELIGDVTIEQSVKERLAECINKDSTDIAGFKEDICLIADNGDSRLALVKETMETLLNFQEDFNILLNLAGEKNQYDLLFKISKLIQTRGHKTVNFLENAFVISSLFNVIIENQLSLERVLTVINTSFPENWVNYLLHEALCKQVLVFFNKDHPKCDKLPDDVHELLTPLKETPLLMDFLIEKLDEEKKLINDLSRISFAQVVDLLIELKEESFTAETNLNYLKHVPLNLWKSFFEKKNWLESLPDLRENIVQKDKLFSIISRLLSNFDKGLVKKFIDLLQKTANLNYDLVYQVSSQFLNYKSLFTSQTIEKLSNKKPQWWISWLERKKNNFEPRYLKTEEILDQLVLNLNTTDSQSDIVKLLDERIKKIEKLYKEKLEDIHPTKPISSWDKAEINKWLKRVAKGKKDPQYTNSHWVTEHLEEVIAVIMRVVQLTPLTDGSSPRDTQLLTLLLYMDAAKNDQGRLGEIATGEGKTVINAMLAIIHALKDKPVNIITSSSMLAERDAKETQGLYEFFGLSVNNNCDEEAQNDLEQRRARYRHARVLYGDVGSFQRDRLLSSFLGIELLENRQDEIIIVDEVDSMLLDKGDNTLYLSHEILDFRHLRHLYVEIWNAVNSPTIHFHNEKEFIEIVKKDIKEKINNQIIRVNPYLADFVQYRLPIWIDCALHARCLEENNQYILRGPKGQQQENVVVMDNDTGVEQANMRWSNGLHQFLQLLEIRKLTPESLKAVFESNLSYFQNYKGRIYGNSGTLGDKTDESLFWQLYHLDFFKMPRFKPHQFEEKKGIVLDSERLWLEEIKKEILQYTNQDNQRSVLVVGENVDKVLKIRKFLKGNDQSDQKYQLHTYKESAKKLSVGDKATPLKPVQVIVATNLASRGKDLVLDNALEINGGLHVIQTYISPNKRIEDQIWGRASRQGKKGSGRFVIMHETIKDLDDLRQERDFNAMVRSEKIRTSTLQFISMEEILLKRFQETYKKIKVELMRTAEKIYDKKYIQVQLKNLEDRWAFWLDRQDASIKAVTETGPESLYTAYDKFHKRMMAILAKDDLFKFVESPHELVDLGQHLFFADKKDNALSCFEKVITDYPEYSEIAYHWKSRIIAEGGKGNLNEIKKSLKSESSLIQHRIYEDIIPTKTASDAAILFNIKLGRGQNTNDFEKQIENELRLYEVRQSSISNIIGKSFTDEIFKDSLSVYDDPLLSVHLRQTLFKKLIEKREFVKSFRLSRKIAIQENERKKILCLSKLDGLKKTLKFPPEFVSCEENILKIIKHQHENSDDALLTQETFLPALAMLPVKEDLAELLWKFLLNEGVIKGYKFKVSHKDAQKDQKIKSIKSFVKKEIADLLESKYIFTANLPDAEDLLDVKKGKAILFQKHFGSWIIHFIDQQKIYHSRNLNSCNDLPINTICRISNTVTDYKIIVSPPSEEWLTLVSKEKLVLFERLDDKWMIHFCHEGKNYAKKEICDAEQINKLKEIAKDLAPSQSITEEVLLKQVKAILMSFGGRISKTDIKALLKTNIFSKFSFFESMINGIEHSKYAVLNGFNFSNYKINRLDTAKLITKEKKIVVTNKQDIETLKAIALLNGSGIDLMRKQQTKAIYQVIDQHIGQMKLLTEFTISVKNIKQLLPNGTCPPELLQFSDMLFDEVLVFNKKASWWNGDVFAVTMLGIAQIALGIALEVCFLGFAPQLGAILIAEGISDLAFAAQAACSGCFSWQAYGVHKAISVAMNTLMAFTMGVGAVASEGINGLKSGTRAILMLDTLILSGKRVALELAKTAGGQLVSFAIDQVLARLPQVVQLILCKGLQNYVFESPQNKEIKNVLQDTMATLFQVIDEKSAKALITESIQEILSKPEDNALFNQILNFAFTLTKELPSALLLASPSPSLLAINTIIATMVGVLEDVTKFAQLIYMIPNIWEKLNQNLLIKVQVIKEVNGTTQVDSLTENKQQFIKEKLQETQDGIAEIIIKKITEEIVKPGFLNMTQKAINAVHREVTKIVCAQTSQGRKQQVHQLRERRKVLTQEGMNSQKNRLHAQVPRNGQRRHNPSPPPMIATIRQHRQVQVNTLLGIRRRPDVARLSVLPTNKISIVKTCESIFTTLLRSIPATTRIYGAVETMNTEHRMKALQLEMLRTRLLTEKKVKEAHELLAKENEKFESDQKEEKRKDLLELLAVEIKQKEKELKHIEKKVKSGFLSELENIRRSGMRIGNGDYLMNILDEQVKAYKEIGFHDTVGTEGLKKILLKIIQKYKKIINDADQERLNALEHAVNHLVKQETNLEQQIALLQWAQEASKSENAEDVDSFLERWGLSPHYKHQSQQEKKMSTGKEEIKAEQNVENPGEQKDSAAEDKQVVSKKKNDGWSPNNMASMAKSGSAVAVSITDAVKEITTAALQAKSSVEVAKQRVEAERQKLEQRKVELEIVKTRGVNQKQEALDTLGQTKQNHTHAMELSNKAHKDEMEKIAEQNKQQEASRQLEITKLNTEYQYKYFRSGQKANQTSQGSITANMETNLSKQSGALESVLKLADRGLAEGHPLYDVAFKQYTNLVNQYDELFSSLNQLIEDSQQQAVSANRFAMFSPASSPAQGQQTNSVATLQSPCGM